MSQANARFCFCLAIALIVHAALFGWSASASQASGGPLLETTRAVGDAASDTPDTPVRAMQHQQGPDDRSREAIRAARATPPRPALTRPNAERPITRFVFVGQEAPPPPETLELQPTLSIDTERDPQREQVLAAARDARAAYLADWQARIEQRGSRRYARRLLDTDEPRRLTLAARLQADGTLRAVRILRSSGNAELDAVALAIVRGAAPFPAFGPALRETTTELSFVYDWSFEPGGATAIRAAP